MRRSYTVVLMTGLGFTFGMFFGLLIQLPVGTLPTSEVVENSAHFRVKRNLGELNPTQFQVSATGDNQFGFSEWSRSDLLSPGAVEKQVSHTNPVIGSKNVPFDSRNAKNNVGQPPLAAIASGQNPLKQTVNRNVVWHDSVEVSEGKQLYKSLPEGTKFQHTRLSSGIVPSDTNNGSGTFKRVVNNVKLQSRSGSQDFNSNSEKVGKISPNSQQNIRSETLIVSDNLHRSTPKSFHGIFWGESLEQLCPGGFTSVNHKAWKKKATNLRFVKMEEGCGRMQNRLLTFDDASKACARYRLNTDQIQGEIYSYYLSKLLKINNLPPATLYLVNSKDDHWRSVHLEIANSQWAEQKVVILTEWVANLTPAYIPAEMREQNGRLHPTSDILGNKSSQELCELWQWSDLIIFDYLTANLDRMINNMFNRQWNDQMMNSPAHNLEKSTDSGQLVFLDNESGLFHGYRLLDKYAPFHEELLQSLCVFRNSTVKAVEHLHKSGNIGEELQRIFTENEPYHNHVPKIPQKNIKILKERLGDVYKQINRCRGQYGS